MKTATVRDLKHQFHRIEEWVRQGERVRITKRGKPLMEIRPPSRQPSARATKIDFGSLLHEIWGERVLSDDEVAAVRDLADGEDA